MRWVTSLLKVSRAYSPAFNRVIIIVYYTSVIYCRRMTKVSKHKINREGKIIYDFWRVASALHTKEEVKNFLKSLLTPTEMLMLAKRVEIAKLLMQGYKYDFITREVQVTNATVAHVKDSLVKGSFNGYVVPLERVHKADRRAQKEHRSKPAQKNLRKTELAKEAKKTSGKHAVKQYRKWHKAEGG